MSRPLRIDSHQHYWRIGRNGHSWPTADLPRLYRDFLPDDLADDLSVLQIDGTIAVQSQPHSDDTSWLLALAEQTPSILGVVGWVDIKAADAVRQIEELAARPKLRGLRPMLQDLPDDWILDPAAAPAIEAMIAHGLVFDALIRVRHIPSIMRLADRFPDLVIVVDHAAKPDIAYGGRIPWSSALCGLGQFPNVVCKLSGLITEAASAWSSDDIAPYIEDVFNTFGRGGVMWGSDWPVMLLRGEYSTWYKIVRDRSEHLNPDEMQDLLGINAARVYGL